MITIDNFKKPKTCYECPFNYGEYEPAYFEKRNCRLTGKSMCKTDYKRRPKNCPIHDVNPDKLIDDILNGFEELNKYLPEHLFLKSLSLFARIQNMIYKFVE